MSVYKKLTGDPTVRSSEPDQGRRIIRSTFYAQLAAFIVSSLTTSVGTMIDGVIIGRYLGEDSMAAFGVINPVIIVFALIGAVISSGARNQFSRLLGHGKVDEARSVFSLSCIMSLGLAIAVMLIIFALSSPITGFLGASGNIKELLPKAQAYLIGVAIGLPAMNILRVLNGYMPIDNDRYLPLIANIVLTVVDILLDLLVVFVLHGDTFEMGLATSISYYAAAAVVLLHFRKPGILLKFSFRGIRWRDAGSIIWRGMPSGICRLSNTIRGVFMNRLLAVIAASAAVAAYSVHRQADSFLNPITIGIADTVALMAGILSGEEDRPMLRRLMLICCHATAVITVAASVLTWFLSPQFAGLYISSDPEALEMSIRAVRCYAIGMPLYGLNLIFGNYLHGIGRNRLSSVCGFLMEGAFMILSAAVLSGWVGADAVWAAFPVSQVLMLICFFVIIVVDSRRLKLRFRGFLDRLLLLPLTFDVPEDDRLDRSITTMDEVIALSDAVWDFCAQHGCDERRRYLMSLCVEEMAGNIIEHGFVDGKRHSIDIRVLKKGEDYILRIRDNCPVFDPTKRVRLFTDHDLVHHIGLRMIFGMAKDVQYTSVMKLNNLVIKV